MLWKTFKVNVTETGHRTDPTTENADLSYTASAQQPLPQHPKNSFHAPHLGKDQTEEAQLRGAKTSPSHVLESQEEQAEQVGGIFF